MHAYVHIGNPKTGSTSIQHWLRKNADALRDRGVAHFRWVIAGVNNTAGQVELLIAAREEQGTLIGLKRIQKRYGIATRQDQTALVAKITGDLQDAVGQAPQDTVFAFSCEHLRPNCSKPGEVAALHTWLSRIFSKITYVLYLRRQEDLVPSRYSQNLRRGKTMTFDAFIAENKVADYAKVVALWADVAPNANLVVRLLERDAMVNGDLLDDFAGVLGVTTEGLSSEPPTNLSFSAAATELMRQLNLSKEPNQRGQGPDGGSADWQIERLLNTLGSKYPKLRLSTQEIAEIRAANEQSNEWVRAHYFPDRAHLFAPRPTDQDTQGVRAVPEDVAALGIEVSRALQAKHIKKGPKRQTQAPIARQAAS